MEFKTADIEDYSLNTIPNLVTSLLSELKKTYVIGSTHRDQKMRDRIERVIQIVSTDSRLGGMIVKANHLMRAKKMRSITANSPHEKAAGDEDFESSNDSDFSSQESDDDDEHLLHMHFRRNKIEGANSARVSKVEPDLEDVVNM